MLLLIVNPHGLTGALYAFTVFNNYGVTITENQTVATLQRIGFVNPDFLFFYLCILVIATAFFVALWKKTMTLKTCGILLLGVVLAFQSIRGFPYLIFLCLPIVLLFLDGKKMSIWIWMLNGGIAVLLLVESFYYLSGTYYQLTYRNYSPGISSVAHAEKAVDFIQRIDAPQPLFNNFDIGSYIIYRMYPSYRVFIDGRPEAYPARFFTDSYLPMQEEYARFQDEVKKWGFKTVVFSIMDQNPRTVHFLYNITQDPEWRTVYLDDFMIVILRADEAERRHLTLIDFATIDVKNYRYTSVVSYTNLSTFLYNMKQYKQAKRFNQKALSMVPENPAANKIMANILIRDEKPNLRLVSEYLSKSSNGVFW